MSSVALKAANWWRSKISIEGPEKYNPLDPDDFGALFTSCMQDHCTNSELDVFVSELTKEIDLALSTDDELVLKCGFYPCEILERCGNIAGFGGLNFPWRTYMTIKNGVISVKDNSSSEFVILT